MTLKLQPNPTFTIPVPLSVPGQESKAVVQVTYRHLSVNGLRDFYSALSGKTNLDGLAEIITDIAAVDEPFSKEALGKLLDNYPRAGAELFEAYRNELLGAREKN